MIKINYEGAGVFEFPETWNEVNLSMFQKVSEIEADLEIEKELAFICTLSGIPLEKILDIPVTEYKKLKRSLNFIFIEHKQDPTPIVTIEGVEYGYRNDISKMKTSEYIDFDTLSSSEDTLIQNLHILMAILYRPISEKGNIAKDPFDYTLEPYNYESVEKRAAIFREKMTMDVVLSAMVFQLALVQALSESTLDSLKQQKSQKKRTKSKTNRILISLKNGGGFSLFTRLREMTGKIGKRGSKRQ